MSVIIRLQNLPLTANSIDIRNFFRGLGIPDGGVHIVGGSEGDAFIAFSTDEDARQGMQLSGTCLKDSPVKLFLSSRNEMYKVIEQARQQALGLMPVSSSSSSPSENSPLPSSQPSQQTSTASIHSQSSTNTLPLSMAAAAGNSMLPGLGLPYHGANSNSNPPVSFPGIGGPLGAGSVSMGPTNFSGSIGSQGNVAGGYPPVFSPQQTTGPPLVPNSLAGPRNMNPMNMNQMSQNPFVMSQSTSGNNIPIGFPSTMPNGPITSNMMGSAAANPNLIGMPSSNVPMLSGSNQFGLGTGSRMPMLNAGSGNLPGGMISPFSMGQGPQSGYTGLNPNLMSSTSNNIGNGNHTGGSMGGSQVRPNFHQNNASLPNRDNRRLGDRPASNFDRPVSNFGKPNAGPMTPMRERDNMGFNARVADRDTRGRERERGERVKRSQSRSRDRKDARDRSRRRSRSREGRDRSRERRRTRRSKSRSRSRDRERTRSRRGSSRDRDRGRDERRRSDAGSGGSPEKGMKSDGSPAVKFGSLAMDAEKKYLGKDRRDSSVENIVVTITDESSPCAKLSGLSKDTSFREDMDSSSVVISGVPPQTNERSVLDFFSEIGLTPLSVRMTYDQNGMPNGQVICEFADPSKARRATTKDGTLFGRIPVKVSLMPSGNSHNRNINPSHMGPLAGNQNSQFPSRGTRPSLLGARPAIPNSNTPRFQSNHQSQNPFTQALQQSMPSPNNSNMMVNVPRLRGPVGERSTRFSNNTSSGGGGGEREDRSKHGVSRHDDMAPFENPGCVLALENVPFKASMDDILNFLKDMLKIQIPRSRIIRRFDDNQKPTGDARVAFDTPFEAKLAYQRLLGSTMWKRQISVSILNYF